MLSVTSPLCGPTDVRHISRSARGIRPELGVPLWLGDNALRDPVVLRNLADHFHALAKNAADPHERDRLSQLARECELRAADWDRKSEAISGGSQVSSE